MEEIPDSFTPATTSSRAFVLWLSVLSVPLLGTLLLLLAFPSAPEPMVSDAPAPIQHVAEPSIDPRLQELLRETGATVTESEASEEEYCEAEGYVWHPEDANHQVGGRYSRYGASHNADASYENVGDVQTAKPRSGNATRVKRATKKVKIQAPTRLRRKRG